MKEEQVSLENKAALGVVNEKVSSVLERFGMFTKMVDEIKTDIKELRTDIRKDLESLNDKFDKTYATKAQLDITNSGLNSVNEDVEDLKDNVKWTVRLVIGSVIIAILGLVISTKIR